MRTSQFLLSTLKETPSDAVVISHQLMLRSGMIRKLTAGIYTWTPLGWRVLKKVERIVREEMDRAGYLELLMPAVQLPASSIFLSSNRHRHQCHLPLLNSGALMPSLLIMTGWMRLFSIGKASR